MEKIRSLFAKIEIQFWKVLVKMMKNQQMLRWSFPVRVLPFLAGIVILSGLIFLPIRATVSSITRRSSANDLRHLSVNKQDDTKKTALSPSNGDQTNYLIIFVDSLDKETPELKGVWLAGHVTALPQVVFLPLYPSLREQETKNYKNLFALADGEKPVDEFVDFLRSKEISWNHYVVLDETSLVELVSLMNRDSVESQFLFPPTSLTGLLNETETIDLQIKAQARFASSLCETAPELVRTADPGIIWSLLTHRMRSDIELQIIHAAQSALAQPGEELVCEFPTLRELTFHTDTH